MAEFVTLETFYVHAEKKWYKVHFKCDALFIESDNKVLEGEINVFAFDRVQAQQVAKEALVSKLKNENTDFLKIMHFTSSIITR